MRLTFALIFAAHLCGCAYSSTDEAPILARAAHFAPGETTELRAWLTANTAAAPHMRAAIYGELCDAESRVGRYAAAARACSESAALLGAEASGGLHRSIAFWGALAGEPPIEVQGEIDAALTQNWTGMALVDVEVRGVRSQWGIDTGAEVSVLRLSDAARMGVRMLDRDVDVTGSTPGVANGGMGVIDLMQIGDAVIRHVPVMVVPDESMTFDERVVPPILGMPLFYMFGAMEFSGHGTRLRTRPTITATERGAIAWAAAGISIPLQLEGRQVRLHLDTGANTTEFHSALTSVLSAAQQADLVVTNSVVAGVSGAIERETSRLPNLAVGVGSTSCEMSNVLFGDEETGAQGRAGIDLVRACEVFALDFTSMSLGARDNFEERD